MSEPEVLPPVDPQEDQWRQMWREHAIRTRIMREEMAKHDPPPPFTLLPRETWFPVAAVFCLGALFALACVALGLLLAVNNHLPVHVVIEGFV